MKRRRPGSGQPGTDQSFGMFEVPTHWTPAQATAVFEVLEELRELVWQNYGGQIQQVLSRDRAITTSSRPTNLEDGDLPF